MKKILLVFLLLACGAGHLIRAQVDRATNGSPAAPLIERDNADDWTSDIVSGWRVHEGDDSTWANPDIDDSSWGQVRLDNLGPSTPGWRWYRLRIRLNENHPELSLLIFGADGAYSLYENGTLIPGPTVGSSLQIKRPTERRVPLNAAGTDLVIALRTFTPPIFPQFHLPLFLDAQLGTPDAIESQRQALESQRLYAALPQIAIDLLLVMAGIVALGLYGNQRDRREYLWLGIYLLLEGMASQVWSCQQNGLLPVAANILIAEPLLYVYTIAQIEFTFSFGGQRVGRWWRAYEAILLVPILLILPCWLGYYPLDWMVMTEIVILLPVALLLPVMLLVWYRRGNTEAGWLIVPSLLPAATVSLFDLGTISIFLSWRRFEFLADPLQIGPIPLQIADAGNLLFLFAIAVVMFFRFTRVSRQQARAAAELGAAREIQQRLVPAALPELDGYTLQAAYLPAQEVGGDFYQVLPQADGCALVVVGDVSGKGLKAAMTGALAIGALRTLAAENMGPAALLAKLSSQIRATQDSGFITCICARIDRHGLVTVANAGHLSPYMGGKEIAVEPGLPMGIAADVEYTETQFRLAAGETMTLLSDGVVEAMNTSGELFGFERTSAISTQLAEEIARAAQTFGQEDDITVLTVARMAAI